MGDRAVIIVKQTRDLPPVCIYGHYLGSGVSSAVSDAIVRGVRWDDPPYLTRILFGSAVSLCGGTLTEETGFGIEVGGWCDNEHFPVLVNIPDQTIEILTPKKLEDLCAGMEWDPEEWNTATVIPFSEASTLVEVYENLESRW